MRCGKLFDAWVLALAGFEGMLVLRCVNTGRIWRSRAVVDAFGLDSHFDTWRNVLNYTDPAGVRALEDSHSRALKLGGTHTFELVGRPGPTSFARFRCAATAHICRSCPHGCAVVIFGAETCGASIVRPESH